MAWLLSVGLGLGARSAFGAEARYSVDLADLDRMGYETPKAVPILKAGEQALLAGEFAAAAARFAEASKLSPKSALAARRECQALTELGRREAAIAACRRAMDNRASVLDRRALVGALMAGPPTPADFYEASVHVTRLKDLMNDKPWSHGAECDVARGIGDERMFRKCLSELVRIAPDHHETRRAARSLESCAALMAPSWFARGFFGLLFVGTLVHALLRRVRGAAPSALALAVLVAPAAARASTDSTSTAQGGAAFQLSVTPIDPKDPESAVMGPEVRDKDPLEFGYQLQDLTSQAFQAEGRGDLKTAVKYWRAIAKAVPDKNVGFLKACAVYRGLKDRESGLPYCRTGVTLPPDVTLGDFQNYAALLFDTSKPLTPEEVAEAQALSTHLERQRRKPEVAQEGLRIQCELAVAQDDLSKLETCSRALASKAPHDPKVISYQFAALISKGDYLGARALIERARAAKLDPKLVTRMEHAVVWWRRALRSPYLPRVAGGLCATGLLLLGARVLLRRRHSPATAGVGQAA